MSNTLQMESLPSPSMNPSQTLITTTSTSTEYSLKGKEDTVEEDWSVVEQKDDTVVNIVSMEREDSL